MDSGDSKSANANSKNIGKSGYMFFMLNSDKVAIRYSI